MKLLQLLQLVFFFFITAMMFFLRWAFRFGKIGFRSLVRLVLRWLGYRLKRIDPDRLWDRRKQQRPGIASSRYLLQIPSSEREKQNDWIRNEKPLLVMLHGCMQNAASMKKGTRIEEVAEREGFYVLYPDQAIGRNVVNCWNWFQPHNQKAGSGEVGEILEMIGAVESEHPIDPKRIFIAGISSGASLAAALLACHPNRFAGGLLHSGPAYASADSVTEGARVMHSGPRSSEVPGENGFGVPANFGGRLLIAHGTADRTVNPLHADCHIEQFVSKSEKASMRTFESHAQCGGLYPARITTYGLPDAPRVCRVDVVGMGHAWSGGAHMAFNDPRGPNINEALVRFLIKGELPFHS